MIGPILVTGATGTVGTHVGPELAHRGVKPRLGVREPASRSLDVPDGTELVDFDFERPETWGPALAGVTECFLVRPPTVATERVTAVAHAAGRTGIDQVAYLSTLSADRNVLLPHHRIEAAIRKTPAAFTFLRASFFTQNLLEVHRPELVELDEIVVPAGSGETSFVDARDVAEAAAVTLAEPGHCDRAYDLTGPDALTYHEVANALTEVLDREITYREPSIYRFARRKYGRGVPVFYIGLMIVLYTTARLGLAGRVSQDLEALLGRRPRTVREFVADYASDFQAEAT